MFPTSSSRYPTFLFALLAVGLFASGAISWIAANWSFFPKMAKLLLAQGLFGLSVVAGLLAYYRESRRQAKPVQSQLWLFLAAVLIGGLFALIGQIYQTGANAWQLFAIWAMLQLPLLWALPNVANALLWLVVLNAAAVLALLLQGQQLEQLLWVVGLNLPLFWFFERFAVNIGDRWRILPHLLLIWLFALFVIGAMIQPESRLGFWAVAAILVAIYRRYHSVRILAFAYIVLDLNLALILLYDDDIAMFVALNLAFLAIASLFFRQINSRLKSALLILLMGLLALSLLGLFALLFGENISILRILPIGLFFVGWKTKKEPFSTLILGVSALLALVIFAFDFLWESVQDERAIYLAGLLLFFGAIYAVNRTFWLRCLLIFAWLICVEFSDGSFWLHQDMYFSVYLNGFCLLLCLACLGCFMLTAENRASFSPPAWGMLAFLLVRFAVQAVYFGEFFANANTPHTVAEYFHAITLGAFDFNQANPLRFVWLVANFSPVWVVGYLIYRQKLAGKTAVLLLTASVLISVGFVAELAITLLFSLLLFAYFQRRKTLWVVAVGGMVVFLALFYYNLQISLLNKAFLLLLEGILLGVIVFGLHTLSRAKTAQIQHGTVRKSVPIAVISTLLATLTTANVAIWQLEAILQQGEKIVLELAPRDPRSLMQGDYMALNYQILNELRGAEMGNETDKQQQTYLRLKTVNGVDQGCQALLFDEPTDFGDCRSGVYLPIKLQHGEVKIAGDSFFFAEGQASHFEQAKFGEFRFKDGKLLLLRLLDSEQKPL